MPKLCLPKRETSEALGMEPFSRLGKYPQVKARLGKLIKAEKA